MMFHLHVTMTFCILLVCIACMYYVLRAPRKIGAKPIGLPSLNKVFTYLLTYLLTRCHGEFKYSSANGSLYGRQL